MPVSEPSSRSSSAAGRGRDPSSPDRSRRPFHPVAFAVFVAALCAQVAFVITTRDDTPLEATVTELVDPEPSEPPSVIAREVQRAKFFDESVQPEIAMTDARNREAADRCLTRLRQVFHGYRADVPTFVADLTSISTRLGIVRRMPANWWKGDGRIEVYVQEKFESHLFSEQQLRRDVGRVLEEFQQEIEANQKHMLVRVQASLAEADLPEVAIDRYEPFLDAVASRLRDYSAGQGKDSVYHALTVLVVSEAGGYAATSMVAGLLARLGSATVVTAAAGAGATAGATATGAGGGSIAGPVGTVVGLGVGLAVGLVIDWWMTEKFEAEMQEQMNGYLMAIEETLLTGNSRMSPTSQVSSEPAPPSSDQVTSGLAGALPQVCDRLRIAYRERFYERIVASPTYETFGTE